MHFDSASRLIIIICVLAFIINGLLCAKANDSRFLSMAETKTGKLIHIIWIPAAILSAIGYMTGKLSPLKFQYVLIGGVTIQLLIEIYRKLLRIKNCNTGTDPNK